MTDKLIILGDFYAREDCDYTNWDGVLGKQIVGGCDSNGLRLLQTCAEHKLLITNTLFSFPKRNRTTWMHPRYRHWHLIDYSFVRAKYRQDLGVTKYPYGADYWADHRLISTKLNRRLQTNRRPQGKKAPKRLNLGWLDCSDTKQSLVSVFEGCLRLVSFENKDIETFRSKFKELV